MPETPMGFLHRIFGFPEKTYRIKRVVNPQLARKYRHRYQKKIGRNEYHLFHTTSGTALTPYVNNRKVKFWLLVRGRLNDDLDSAYIPIFYNKNKKQ